MRKLTATATALALLALASPAGATPKPPQGWAHYDVTFPLPSKVLPGGITPGTPRQDWDFCDQPGALWVDSWFTLPSKRGPGSGFQGTQFTSSMAVSDKLGDIYNPLAPPNPYQPWPAYATCTVSGPTTVPSAHTHIQFRVTFTNISNQPVYVAYEMGSPKETVPTNTGLTGWAHEHWLKLMPGQSSQLNPPWVTLHNKLWWEPLLGYWLIRPSVSPPNLPNFTEWIPTDFAFGFGPKLVTLNPTGTCRAGLLPGTVTGIASAPTGGYWVLSNNGQVAGCDAPQYGNLASDLASSGPPNFIASATRGYWAANRFSEVIPFGGAPYLGQFDGNIAYNPKNGGLAGDVEITGFASTPSHNGYWLLTAYGKVLAYHAPYYGSADFAGATVCRWGGVPCSRSLQGSPVLTPHAAAGLAPTDGGKGYVIVARDGTTARFGKAPSCSLPASVSVVGVAADYRTGGYWVATTDGQVYACQAPSYPFKAVTGKVAGIAGLDNGLGYRLVTTNGRVYDYGSAVWHGDPN